MGGMIPLHTHTHTHTKNMKITRIIKRHHFACFTVEDENGNHFLVQLDYGLEEIWQKSKN